MQNMGMTDKQFSGFVRFVLDDIKELKLWVFYRESN